MMMCCFFLSSSYKKELIEQKIKERQVKMNYLKEKKKKNVKMTYS